MATDELLLESTLIVVAYRLRTVADFDRIEVIAEGGIQEAGSPKELWEGMLKRVPQLMGFNARLATT